MFGTVSPSSTHRDDLCMTPVEAEAIYAVFRGPRSQIAGSLRGKIRGYLLIKKISFGMSTSIVRRSFTIPFI